MLLVWFYFGGGTWNGMIGRVGEGVLDLQASGWFGVGRRERSNGVCPRVYY